MKFTQHTKTFDPFPSIVLISIAGIALMKNRDMVRGETMPLTIAVIAGVILVASILALLYVNYQAYVTDEFVLETYPPSIYRDSWCENVQDNHIQLWIHALILACVIYNPYPGMTPALVFYGIVAGFYLIMAYRLNEAIDQNIPDIEDMEQQTQ